MKQILKINYKFAFYKQALNKKMDLKEKLIEKKEK